MSKQEVKIKTNNLERRTFLLFGTAAAAISISSEKTWAVDGPSNKTATMMGELVEDGEFEINKSESEWRDLLTQNQFLILRKEKTERKFTSPFLDEKRAGLYHCSGCNLPVYDNADKYDSRTGWPSYTRAVPDAVRVKEDNGFFSTRTEVHCRRCGGHLGHIFDDGPKPTGFRHCINGLAMTFNPTS